MIGPTSGTATSAPSFIESGQVAVKDWLAGLFIYNIVLFAQPDTHILSRFRIYRTTSSLFAILTEE